MGIQFYAFNPDAADVADILPEHWSKGVGVGSHWKPVFDALRIRTTDPYNSDPNHLSGFDMMQRVKYALRTLETDPGSGNEIDWNGRRATVITIGRREGYTQEKLRALDELATRCARKGWRVAWA
jgi:hypothetical protein